MGRILLEIWRYLVAPFIGASFLAIALAGRDISNWARSGQFWLRVGVFTVFFIFAVSVSYHNVYKSAKRRAEEDAEKDNERKIQEGIQRALNTKCRTRSVQIYRELETEFKYGRAVFSLGVSEDDFDYQTSCLRDPMCLNPECNRVALEFAWGRGLHCPICGEFVSELEPPLFCQEAQRAFRQDMKAILKKYQTTEEVMTDGTINTQ